MCLKTAMSVSIVHIRYVYLAPHHTLYTSTQLHDLDREVFVANRSFFDDFRHYLRIQTQIILL